MAILHVNHESVPEDVEFDVPPHGAFKNKHKYEVEWLEEDTILGGGEELKGKAEKDPNVGEQEPVETPAEGSDLPTGGTVPSDDLHDPGEITLDDEEGDK